jgi:hypothetical protein
MFEGVIIYLSIVCLFSIVQICVYASPYSPLVHNTQQLLFIVFSFAYTVALLLLLWRWLRDRETDSWIQERLQLLLLLLKSSR